MSSQAHVDPRQRRLTSRATVRNWHAIANRCLTQPDPMPNGWAGHANSGPSLLGGQRIVASLLIHHLPPDVKQAALTEIHRVLTRDGRLLVAEPDRPDYWLWRILVWPISLHPNMGDHLQGCTGDMLRSVGFASVIPTGRWAHCSTWHAHKSSNDVFAVGRTVLHLRSRRYSSRHHACSRP